MSKPIFVQNSGFTLTEGGAGVILVIIERSGTEERKTVRKGIPMIYLDNAATTIRKPPEVTDAVIRAMTQMGNSGRSVHGGSLEASRVIFGARESLAALFHCPRPDHVIFTSNATEALNIAIFGLISPGDHVISTDLEHNSVLRPLYELSRRGASVSFLPADRKGTIDLAMIGDLIRPETKALIMTHASNLTGNVTDIREAGRIAKKHGLLFVVDASQTAGSFPIDMEKDGIDVLCFAGHKGLMGPQGTGCLLVRPGVEIRPFKFGGTGVQSHLETQPAEYPVRLEAGTLNGWGIAGLGAAAEFVRRTGPENIHRKEMQLMERFLAGVREIPGITLYGDFAHERAAVAALNLKDVSSSELCDALWQDYEIATRAGAHCAPRMHAALGTAEQGACRFSFGYYNTEEDADAAVSALRELAEEGAC